MMHDTNIDAALGGWMPHPETLLTPPRASASGLLAEAARRYPERPAIADGGTRLTFAELDDLVGRLAAGLAARDVHPGDRVCLVAKNGLGLVAMYLAINRAGAVTGMLNNRLAPRELAHLVAMMGPKLLAYEAAFRDKVGAAAGGVPRLLELGTGNDDRWGGLEQLAAAAPEPPVDGDAPSVMMHTSGTTGHPKVVVLSRRSEWLNAVMTLATLPADPGDRNINVAPLFHAGPLECSFLPHLAVGSLNVLVSDFDPAGLIAAVEEEGATSLLLVPTHVELLRQAWPGLSVDPGRLRSLRDVVVTGARISQAAVDWAREHLSERLWNMYGLTEAGALITVCRPDELDVTDQGPAIGRSIVGMDVRVARPGDTGAPMRFLPPGAVGELVCTGPKLMSGYLDQPDKTAERIAHGWLRTGDVGVVLPDGLIRVVDRLDDLINSGGENIYPMEVEGALSSLPGVVEVAVVGRPHDTWGEEVVAFVVPGSDGVTAEELLALAKGLDIAPYKLPKRIELLDTLPRTASGKLVKRLLPD